MSDIFLYCPFVKLNMQRHRHADEHNCELQIQPKPSPVQSTRSLIQQRYGQQPATPVNKQTSEGAQRAIKKLKIIRQSTVSL